MITDGGRRLSRSRLSLSLSWWLATSDILIIHTFALFDSSAVADDVDEEDGGGLLLPSIWDTVSEKPRLEPAQPHDEPREVGRAPHQGRLSSVMLLQLPAVGTKLLNQNMRRKAHHLSGMEAVECVLSGYVRCVTHSTNT
eukprot:scaffold216481_cov29-Prasinocladus_malaysianus.AAC.1